MTICRMDGPIPLHIAMELRQLKYFTAVVDAGSITRAATLSHVVQSAISHQIAQLEQEIGSVLLTRGVNGAQPTDSGRIFYQHAQFILKQVRDAKDAAASADGQVQGAVSLGIPNSTAAIFAVPLMSAMRTLYPDVRLSIYEGLSGTLADDLANGRLDMSILFNSPGLDGFSRRPICSERYFFMSADPKALAAFADRKRISLSEVAAWPLLLPSFPNSSRTTLDDACGRKGIKLQVVGEVNSLRTLWDSVIAQLGSTILTAPSASLAPQKTKYVLVPLVNPSVFREVVVAQRSNSAVTRAAAAVHALTIERLTALIRANKWAGVKLV